MAGVTGAAQAAPLSGSQQTVVAQTAVYAALSFILSRGLSRGGTNWSARTTTGMRGA